MPKGLILIVDDDASVQRYLELLLRRKGYGALIARNGNEALRLLDQRTFRVVLLDIYMPVKGGFETLIEVIKSYPETKIIAMSGESLFGPHSSLDIARSLGAHAVLAKPFKASELLDKIAELS